MFDNVIWKEVSEDTIEYYFKAFNCFLFLLEF